MPRCETKSPVVAFDVTLSAHAARASDCRSRPLRTPSPQTARRMLHVLTATQTLLLPALPTTRSVPPLLPRRGSAVPMRLKQIARRARLPRHVQPLPPLHSCPQLVSCVLPSKSRAGAERRSLVDATPRRRHFLEQTKQNSDRCSGPPLHPAHGRANCSRCAYGQVVPDRTTQRINGHGYRGS